MANRTMVLSLAIALALLAAGRLAAVQPEEPEERFFGQATATAVEVVVEVTAEDGETPVDLKPADFELLEAGEKREISAVEPAFELESTPAAAARERATDPEGWHITIYVDEPLCDPKALQQAVSALAEQSGLMTLLGEVEIVVADPRPRRVLAPTREAAKVKKALGKLGKRGRARQDLVALRREFLRKLGESDIDQLLPSGEGGRRVSSGTGSGTIIDRTGRSSGGSPGEPNQLARSNRQRMLVRSAAQQEHQFLARQRLFLNDWLALAPSAQWRALLMVSDGYDLRPGDFYLDALEDSRLISELANELESLSSGPAAEELALQLAAERWTVVNISLGSLGSLSSLSSSEAGGDRYRSFFGDRRGGRRSSSGSYFTDPLGPLLLASQITAGDLVADHTVLEASLERLGRRLRLVYQVDRPPDGILRPIEIRSLRPGLTVRAPRVAASAPPGRIMAARARQLLADAAPAGDLVVQLVVEPPGDTEAGPRRPTMRAEVDLDGLESLRATLTRAELRVTVAIELPDGRISISQQMAHEQDLSRLATWRYIAPMAYPAGSPRVAVVIDELKSGAWGGAAGRLP